jgi:hypothetical protein
MLLSPKGDFKNRKDPWIKFTVTSWDLKVPHRGLRGIRGHENTVNSFS